MFAPPRSQAGGEGIRDGLDLGREIVQSEKNVIPQGLFHCRVAQQKLRLWRQTTGPIHRVTNGNGAAQGRCAGQHPAMGAGGYGGIDPIFGIAIPILGIAIPILGIVIMPALGQGPGSKVGDMEAGEVHAQTLL